MAMGRKRGAPGRGAKAKAFKPVMAGKAKKRTQKKRKG